MLQLREWNARRSGSGLVVTGVDQHNGEQKIAGIKVIQLATIGGEQIRVAVRRDDTLVQLV